MKYLFIPILLAFFLASCKKAETVQKDYCSLTWNKSAIISIQKSADTTITVDCSQQFTKIYDQVEVFWFHSKTNPTVAASNTNTRSSIYEDNGCTTHSSVYSTSIDRIKLFSGTSDPNIQIDSFSLYFKYEVRPYKTYDCSSKSGTLCVSPYTGSDHITIKY